MLASIAEFLLRHLVFLLMLWLGLVARPRDVAHIGSEPRLYLRALVAIDIGVPLLAMVVVTLVPLPPLSTHLVLLMAICPGAAFITMAGRQKGTAYSRVGLNLLLLLSVLAPVTIPIWIWVIDNVLGKNLGILPGTVVKVVVGSLILPLLLGGVLRRLVPELAEKLAKVVHGFFHAALLLALVFALVRGAPILFQAPLWVLLVVALMVVGSAALGYWAGTPAPQDRPGIADAAAMGNPALALAVAASSFPGFKPAAFIAAYVLLRKLVLILFDAWAKRRTPVEGKLRARRPHGPRRLAHR